MGNSKPGRVVIDLARARLVAVIGAAEVEKPLWDLALNSAWDLRVSSFLGTRRPKRLSIFWRISSAKRLVRSHTTGERTFDANAMSCEETSCTWRLASQRRVT